MDLLVVRIMVDSLEKFFEKDEVSIGRFTLKDNTIQ